MPPRSALIRVAELLDLQIINLQTSGTDDSVLPDFLQKGCLKKTQNGVAEYNFGADVHINSIETLQPAPTNGAKNKPKPSVKRRQRQPEGETPLKGYQRKRHMTSTSTPAKQ